MRIEILYLWAGGDYGLYGIDAAISREEAVPAGKYRNSSVFFSSPPSILSSEPGPISIQNAMNTPPMDKATLDHLKQKTARLSILSNTGLVLMKFMVGFTIGSVSIISEAIHSSMDLIAAVIAFFSVRKSAEPPDAAHSFGHGKFEDISGLTEALLIFVAAILIIREAVIKLLGQGPEELKPGLLLAGISIMGISALVNWYVSHRLMKVAKQSESIALESDAWHLRTDVYTSLGVFLGLILIKLTGNPIFDPLFALGVAVVIMKAAYDLTKRSLSDLIDHSIPREDEDRIKEIICEHSNTYAGFHDLKTRRSGPEIFIEFHLVVPGEISVEASHDLTDHLESDLNTEFPRSTITIHVEPCNEGCTRCGSFCTFYEKQKTGPEHG
jgi:cation diffusion facilitator family transporter